MDAAEFTNEQRKIDPPKIEPDYEFRHSDTFRVDSRAVARRALYLAWTYREMFDNFAFPAGRDTTGNVAELGVLFLEIIGRDMRKLHEAAFPPRRPAPAEELLRARRAAYDNETPHFESAEEVKRAFDLLQAEKSREAGAIPLDRDGRPIP